MPLGDLLHSWPQNKACISSSQAIIILQRESFFLLTNGDMQVEGPVRTQFGYHLIYITRRA